MENEARQTLAFRSWFDPGELGVAIRGRILRPFSLGSVRVQQALKINLYAFEYCDESLLAYLWSHSEPLEAVLRALHSGRESEALQAFEFGVTDLPELGAELSRYMVRVQDEIDACYFEIQPRKPRKQQPGEEKEEAPPKNLLEPSALDSYAWTVQQSTGWSERRAVWETPLSTVLRKCHVNSRANLAWTVPPKGVTGNGTNPEDEAALDRVMKELAEPDQQISAALGQDPAAAFDWLAEVENGK